MSPGDRTDEPHRDHAGDGEVDDATDHHDEAAHTGHDGDTSARGDGGTRLDRRRLLVGGGLGGALLLGGGIAGARGRGAATAGGVSAPYAGARPTDATAAHDAHGGHDVLAALGVVRDGYGHGPTPPRSFDADAAATAWAVPPRDDRPAGSVRTVDVPVTARRWEVAEGAGLDAWVYGGRLPGPVLRATVGDRLRLRVTNRTDLGHNLHLHGTHDPQMDGWEPIPAGEEFTYDVVAGPAGLHPYHCHTPPLAEHIRRGLYGLLIVDPEPPREPAIEVALVLGGFDVDGDGRDELYGFNGACGLYHRFPITVPVGELVRVHLANFVEGEPVAGFHLHAQTFDVFRSGTSLEPDEHTDQITLGQADRAILEFRLPTRGRYMFHPHQHHLAERGAMGWFSAV